MSHFFLRAFIISLSCLSFFLFSCNGGSDDPVDPSNNNPIASFTASPSSGNAPLTVTFNASASSDSDGSIVSYSWNFGDATTGSGVTVSHTYTVGATYTVVLTVADDDGVTGTASIPVIVTDTEAVPDNTIKGTITAPDFTAIDGDTNDPYSTNTDNDSIATAQQIANPAMVGGFVCDSATGLSGDRFESSPDVSDYYDVSLAAGQAITLAVSDYAGDSSINLDLVLYNSSGTEVDRSQGTVESERLTVSSSGDYYIRVFSYSGTSNYVMSVGQPDVTESSHGALSMEDEFVPGEVMVRFKNNHLAQNIQDSVAARASSLGLMAKAGGAGREMLFTLPVGPARHQAMASLGVGDVDYEAKGVDEADEKEKLRLDTILTVQALRQRADVASADLNYIRYPYATPNDSYYSYQWHYPLINLPQAWEITTDTSGSVIVAVADTGVFMSHEDLTANLTNTGYDFISDSSIANDGGGIDSNPDDPGDSNTPGSSSYHGTHVAGTVSAASNNSSGVAGVSWGTKIMPIRVLGVGGGTGYDIIQGIRYAAGLSNDSGTTPSQAADIINLSLGGGGYSSTEQSAYTDIRNAGVIVIAAAGNENTSTLGYPASYEGVVSVAAVDMHKDRAPYSNYGTAIDVAAPGGDTSVDDNGDGYSDGVLSTLVDDSGGSRQESYVFYQGTSMASPHMAGVVALMKAVHPGLTPAQLDSALEDGDITDDLGTTGRDNTYGHGLIDALKAVQKANELANTSFDDPILSTSPSLLNFGSNYDRLTFTVSNGGGGTLTVTDVTDDAAWLSVTPTSGLGTYTAIVDRTSLVEANYSANISFTSNAGTDTLSVTMSVGSATSGGGNAGYHWLILIDPITKETYATIQSPISDGGLYDYSFESVVSGEYFVVGGTDSDNDGFLCDKGEACGGYPSVELLKALTMSGPGIGSMDFNTGFSLGLDSAAAAGLGPQGQGFSKIPVQKEVE